MAEMLPFDTINALNSTENSEPQGLRSRRNRRVVLDDMEIVMLLPFDELEELEQTIIEIDLNNGGISDMDTTELSETFLDLLILDYMDGTRAANEMLGLTDKDEVMPEVDPMRDTIFEEYDGKTFVDRIKEYVEADDMESLFRVFETDMHRVYNAAAFNTAKAAGAKQKRWVCMFRNSRDTHIYLHGTTIDIERDFYSYTGAHAPYPGMFHDPHEDCNCQCFLEFLF